ncbi:MAG: hypothetical protein OXI22_23670 [Defluviicoccus sp.]|nr:hypothetical protein [Defluviicoccus sp.]MDE0386900.1 hypothetical protein [Defluviicoccus sp.]
MSEALDYATLGVGLAILAFLWNLHRDFTTLQRDFASLRERIARLEGAVELLTRFLIDRERERPAAGQ